MSLLGPSLRPCEDEVFDCWELLCCEPPNAPNLPLFNSTISFNQLFSRRNSDASRSNSSDLPVKSATVRSRLSTFCFFLIRNLATSRRSGQKMFGSPRNTNLRQMYFFCAYLQRQRRLRLQYHLHPKMDWQESSLNVV